LEEIAQRETKTCVFGETKDPDPSKEKSTSKAEGEEGCEDPVCFIADANVVIRDKFLKYVQCHPLQKSGVAFRGLSRDTLYFNFPSYIEHRILVHINRISMEVS
jgi:hypothetical protein